MDIEFVERAVPILLSGTLITLQIGGLSLLLGLIIGIPLAFMRVYGGRILKGITLSYSEILRGTPVLVQLFLVYYGLPQFGIVFDPIPAAFLTLGINSAAYQVEYLRGAITSVGDNQMMAARSLGMSTIKAIRCVILPQAMRLVLPSWSNEAIYMIKNTAVVYLIAVPDLMTKTKIMIARYYNPIESYMLVSVFYLVLVAFATLIFHTIERRFKIPGLQLEERR
jgi:polar amino acid transport system permease protein